MENNKAWENRVQEIHEEANVVRGRESEICECYAEGLTVREISEKLGYTDKFVGNTIIYVCEG